MKDLSVNGWRSNQPRAITCPLRSFADTLPGPLRMTSRERDHSSQSRDCSRITSHRSPVTNHQSPPLLQLLKNAVKRDGVRADRRGVRARGELRERAGACSLLEDF